MLGRRRMSLAKINDVYLTVGTRSRRAANIAGATYLGDKGVGRLSAMRLFVFACPVLKAGCQPMCLSEPAFA